MLKSITMVTLVLSSLLIYTHRISADDPIIIPTTPQEYIVLFAQKFQTPVKPLLAVAKCESEYNPASTGDHGLAKGIFQFHPDTFKWMSSLMGEKLDYHSTADQAKLASWIFKNYPKLRSHWTCSKLMHVI